MNLVDKNNQPVNTGDLLTCPNNKVWKVDYLFQQDHPSLLCMTDSSVLDIEHLDAMTLKDTEKQDEEALETLLNKLLDKRLAFSKQAHKEDSLYKMGYQDALYDIIRDINKEIK